MIGPGARVTSRLVYTTVRVSCYLCAPSRGHSRESRAEAIYSAGKEDEGGELQVEGLRDSTQRGSCAYIYVTDRCDRGGVWLTVQVVRRVVIGDSSTSFGRQFCYGARGSGILVPLKLVRDEVNWILKN